MKEGMRLFIRDALEAAIVSAGALAFTIPANLDDAKRESLVVAVAVGSAVWAVARRELVPLILNWISPAKP